MQAQLQDFFEARGWDVEVEDDLSLYVTVPTLEAFTSDFYVEPTTLEAGHVCGNMLVTANAISLMRQYLDLDAYTPTRPFHSPTFYTPMFNQNVAPDRLIHQLPFIRQPVTEPYITSILRSNVLGRIKPILLARIMGHTPFDTIDGFRGMFHTAPDHQTRRLILHMVAAVAQRKAMSDEDMLYWSQLSHHSTCTAAPFCKRAILGEPQPFPEQMNAPPTVYSDDGEAKTQPPEKHADLFGRSIQTFGPYFLPRKYRERVEECLRRAQLPFERVGDWIIRLPTVIISFHRDLNRLIVRMTPLLDDEVTLMRAWKCLNE